MDSQPQIPQQQISPLPPQTPNNFPWFKIILLILIISLPVGIGGYILGTQKNQSVQTEQNQQISPSITTTQPSPTPDPTVNWKIYTDPKGKYSFQYPINWYLYQDSGGVTIYDRPKDQIPAGGGDSNSVEIGYTATGSFSPNFAYDNGPNKPNTTIKQYTINNYSGIRGQQAQGQDIVYLKNPNGGYASFILWDESNNEDVFNQILSTFKFTDQNDLKPADSQTPAAGICAGPSNETTVTVITGMDNIPQPRCSKVTSTQKIKIINNSDQTINGIVGPYTIHALPGQSQTIDATFGSYLLPGVHNFPGGGEIWLQK